MPHYAERVLSEQVKKLSSGIDKLNKEMTLYLESGNDKSKTIEGVTQLLALIYSRMNQFIFVILSGDQSSKDALISDIQNEMIAQSKVKDNGGN